MAAKECKLLTEYNTATAETLVEINAEIAKVEGEAKACKGKIAGLRTLRRAIDEKLNGRKSRKPMVRKAKAGVVQGASGGDATTAHREKAAKYLAHSGPTRPAIIAQQCGIPVGSISAVLDCSWFEKHPAGVALSAEGKRKAG